MAWLKRQILVPILDAVTELFCGFDDGFDSGFC